MESKAPHDAQSSALGDEAARARVTAIPLLLHIGYHKTGSTWLQRAVFDNAGRGFTTETGEPRHALVRDFVLPDALAYDPARMRDKFAEARAEALAGGKTLVLSHERLSGYPSSGGHDRRMIADRLRETFPDARILIVIREQRALIRSMYSQHITDGGTGTLARFLARPEPGLGRKPWFDPEVYAFDRLIAYYRGLFGADRILALPFELLTRDPQLFVDRLAAFCGRPSQPLGPVSRENDRRPLVMQAVQRRLNALFYDNELSPGAFVHIPRFAKRFGRLRGLFDACSPRFIERRMDARLVKEIAAYAGDRFRESNRRTSRMIGIDLGDYGYAMPHWG